MNAIAFANRLARDLNEKSVMDLTADARLEILDATNGALQKLDQLAPFQSKVTVASLFLDAPLTLSLEVTNGSGEVADIPFTKDQYGRTIRIEGDDIDNQIVGENQLLHAYTGASGTVTATVYSDAVPIPEPYLELISDPKVIEIDRTLIHHRPSVGNRKAVSQPTTYWIESNARNQNPSAPAVLRLHSFPDRMYRLLAEFSMAPARVCFTDLISPGPSLPIREEYVESYLLPVARGILSNSSLWTNKDSIARAREDSSTAEIRFEALVPKSLATPNNRVGTPAGF